MKKLRVCHHPQVPGKSFKIEVTSESQAFKVSSILAFQHIWLEKNNIIPDFSNAIYVQQWDEWAKTWEDYGNDQYHSWEEWEESHLGMVKEFLEVLHKTNFE